jgi:hypothetical protein
VAILDDPTFFSLPPNEQRCILEPFDWAEFRATLAENLPLLKMSDAGFTLADTQVHFRIRLRDLSNPLSDCSAGLTLRAATETGTLLDESEWAIFHHERFRHLPGVNTARLNVRYSMWAESLLKSDPRHCFQILYEGLPQGWFLARPESGDTLNLTLGVLRRDARVSGYAVYEAALRRFASMNYRVGCASFSISNTPVHNIYSQLGARFVRPVGMWLWVRRSSAA